MKRVVYSPKVSAFVKADSGIYDLSPYIVRGNVTRSLDQVSTATLEFRNPNKKFTEGGNGAIFHPMDPILIFMTRVEDHPVHVFTGYIDSSPYFTLKPGVVALNASCTLKRLLYTYFDPGLDFFHRFLHKRGWQTTPGLGVTSDEQQGQSVDQQTDDENRNVTDRAENESGNLNDSSFGDLLYDTLRYIGNWPDDTIWIENLPDGIVDLVEGIFYQIEDASDEQRKQMRKLLKQILAHNELSSGGLGGGSDRGPGSTPSTFSPVNGSIVGLNNPAHEEFCNIVAGGTGLSLRVLAAWCDVEGGPADNPLNIGPHHTFGSVKAGARATIKLLKQSLYSMITKSAGKSDQEQIRAIASSPWLTGSAVFTKSYYDSILRIWQEIKVTNSNNRPKRRR